VVGWAGSHVGPYRDLVLRTLRQPRYATLGVLMLIVAIGCVAAGTWQIARFQQKLHENDALQTNAHRGSVGVDEVLPLVGRGRTPSDDAVEFRAVTATGRYDAAGQTLVRSRTVGDSTGFLVLTPLRTGAGTLLIVRGFVAQPTSGGVPDPGAPPAGTVTVTARVHPPESRHDAADQLTQHQVESINPREQAARLGGGPIYNGYAELEPREAGTSGLTALPNPDLSNPAGGALEPQHFAYVVQWYLFAVLALAAPFAMARAETRTRRTTDIDDLDSDPVKPARNSPPTAEEVRAAKLVDRYGHAR
jgi:cytochrome oxidase assembly protein ShyY1